MSAPWRAVLSEAQNLIWPPLCPVSHQPVRAHGELAAEAWSRLRFVADPLCRTCGLPFDYPFGGADVTGRFCASCIARPPYYDRARAPLVYDEVSRDLVLPLKHADRRESVERFARWMWMSIGRQVQDGALILPVPLHWKRLMKRRYNQAGLLARAMARQAGLGFEPDLLLRRKATPSQAGQGARSRKRNVSGAFELTGKLEGQDILLVDDVLTTGATVNACASLLKRSGSGRVDVVTLCRVVRETDLTI
ncbi:ComF family protein [Maricaulis sp.]|uniref:ComF family protein n=1 Tax=unclassified Maricaulis TaxID=2632371 RepID=UPI001B0EF2C9|nr:ComF family protein [Maricaulis sp.]MBO6797412.1 ComF family protein [Maricaulis sp.]